MIVENNYGYTNIFDPGAGAVVTRAGFAGSTFRRDGKGCKKIWTNKTERAPSVVPKMSAKTGLIYSLHPPA